MNRWRIRWRSYTATAPGGYELERLEGNAWPGEEWVEVEATDSRGLVEPPEDICDFVPDAAMRGDVPDGPWPDPEGLRASAVDCENAGLVGAAHLLRAVADRIPEVTSAKPITLEVCSHCGEPAGASAHGHRNGSDWHWERVEYVPVYKIAGGD